MRTILAISALLLLSGCNNDSAVVVPLPAEAFGYKAYDASGLRIAEGWFRFAIHDSAHISGEWHFARTNPTPNIGPQIGDGVLNETYQYGVLSLNLNPGNADNNVFLQGDYSGSSFAGDWVWIGFAGPINSGRFEATKDAVPAAAL